MAGILSEIRDRSKQKKKIKPRGIPSLLSPPELFTEGRTPVEEIEAGSDFKGKGAYGDIVHKGLTADAQTKAKAKYAKEDIARSKIKPILDPEGDKSARRRKAAKRKQAGRAGTLLSSRETLG